MRDSTRRSARSAAKLQRVDGWSEFRGSGRSCRPRWSPRSGMARSLTTGASSRPGWVWCPDNAQPEAGTCCLGSAREGTSIFARCSSTVRGQRCEQPRGARIAAVDGRLRYSSAAARTSRPWHWRTRTYGPRGHCWRERSSTSLWSLRRSPFAPGGRAANGCMETVHTMARQVGPTHRDPVVITGHQDRQSDEGGVCGFQGWNTPMCGP